MSGIHPLRSAACLCRLSSLILFKRPRPGPPAPASQTALSGPAAAAPSLAAAADAALLGPGNGGACLEARSSGDCLSAPGPCQGAATALISSAKLGNGCLRPSGCAGAGQARKSSMHPNLVHNAALLLRPREPTFDLLSGVLAGSSPSGGPQPGATAQNLRTATGPLPAGTRVGLGFPAAHPLRAKPFMPPRPLCPVNPSPKASTARSDLLGEAAAQGAVSAKEASTAPRPSGCAGDERSQDAECANVGGGHPAFARLHRSSVQLPARTAPGAAAATAQDAATTSGLAADQIGSSCEGRAQASKRPRSGVLGRVQGAELSASTPGASGLSEDPVRGAWQGRLQPAQVANGSAAAAAAVAPTPCLSLHTPALVRANQSLSVSHSWMSQHRWSSSIWLSNHIPAGIAHALGCFPRRHALYWPTGLVGQGAAWEFGGSLVKPSWPYCQRFC